MPNVVPERDRVIRHVDSVARGQDARVRLSTAVSIASDLQDLSDAVLDHFVEEARDGGLPWVEIGDALGVTKQAAQQRFLDLARMAGPDCSEIQRWMTPKAKRSVRSAHKEARRLRCVYVGTEHLMIAILRARRALAGRVVADLGASPEEVIEGLEAVVDPKRKGGPGTLTPHAVGALLAALDEAQGLGHNYVGTEHLLLGLLASGGKASTVSRHYGVTYSKARRAATALLSG